MITLTHVRPNFQTFKNIPDRQQSACFRKLQKVPQESLHLKIYKKKYYLTFIFLPNKTDDAQNRIHFTTETDGTIVFLTETKYNSSSRPVRDYI